MLTETGPAREASTEAESILHQGRWKSPDGASGLGRTSLTGQPSVRHSGRRYANFH